MALSGAREEHPFWCSSKSCAECAFHEPRHLSSLLVLTLSSVASSFGGAFRLFRSLFSLLTAWPSLGRPGPPQGSFHCCRVGEALRWNTWKQGPNAGVNACDGLEQERRSPHGLVVDVLPRFHRSPRRPCAGMSCDKDGESEFLSRPATRRNNMRG